MYYYILVDLVSDVLFKMMQVKDALNLFNLRLPQIIYFHSTFSIAKICSFTISATFQSSKLCIITIMAF